MKKLDKTLKKHLKTFTELKESAAAANSELNKHKTVLRNFIKSYHEKEKLPLGTYHKYNGIRLDYCATESDAIDPDDFVELFVNEKIDREQFVRCLSVSVASARKEIGGDVADTLITKKTGETVDVRLSTLPVDEAKDEGTYIRKIVKTIRRKVKTRGRDSSPKQAISRVRRLNIKK